MCDWCGNGFRFEATDLYTGRVKAVLHPISAEWEDGYSRNSTGSLLLATRDPSQDDVWCSTTGVYISQVLPDGSRLPRWGGYAEDFHGAGGGAVTLACNSMDTFLNHRLVAGPDGGYTIDVGGDLELFTVYKPDSTGTLIPIYTSELPGRVGLAVALVRIAQGNLEGEGFKGLPTLTAVADTPATYGHVDLVNWWDFKNIGQWVNELVTTENGIKYWLEHQYANGFWNTVMHIADSIGTDRDYVLKSDREGWNYSLEVDAKDKASRVYGIGSRDEEQTMFSVAYDEDMSLPEYQATVAWKDQNVAGTLDNLTKGYVSDHRDPTTVPAMTVVGLPIYSPDDPQFDPQTGFPAPEICRPGDTFGVELGYGVITVHGIRVRNLAVAWKLEDGNPVQRTIAMQPLIRPSLSIRTQVPALEVLPEAPLTQTDPTLGGSGAVTVDPWPAAGLVTRVHPNYLHEISGMQGASGAINPDIVYVHNDNEVNEIGDPVGTVYMVSKIDGKVKGKWVQRAQNQPHAIDTEAIRMRFTPYGTYTGRTIWLGDIGNNDHTTRGTTPPRVYIIDEPRGGGDKGYLTATVLRLNYPFGQRNAETLLIDPVTGVVRIVTKENGKARVVNFGANPTDNMTGTVEKTITDGLELVTDGDMTRDGKFALFRAYQTKATLVYRVSDWTRVGQIDTPSMPKSESISVEGRCSFLVGTEAKPHEPISETETPIYRVLIPTQFGATCGTPAGTSGTPSTSPSGPVVPGQVLDLTRWKLTLPTGTAGHPKEITQPALATYENPSYFWADTAADGVHFKCPVNGVTTSGSAYPRTELRQMKKNGTDLAAWSNSSATWTMEAVLKFAHLPGGKPHVVGMQVHDSNDDVTVLRREGSDLYVTKGDNPHYKKIATGITDSTVLNMKVVANPSGFHWYRDGVEVATIGGTRSGMYFKSGAYVQASPTSSPAGSGYGEVVVYSLRIFRS